MKHWISSSDDEHESFEIEFTTHELERISFDDSSEQSNESDLHTKSTQRTN